MASNLLSRLLPPTTGSPSIYQTLRENDESSGSSDIEERVGIALLDEENLAHHNFELDPALADAMESQLIMESLHTGSTTHNTGDDVKRIPRWLQRPRKPVEVEEADDEVPLSLLIEDRTAGNSTYRQPTVPPQQLPNLGPVPIAGNATRATRAKWQATQEQQQLHPDGHIVPVQGNTRGRRAGFMAVDPKEKALWRWANVENLDNFLKEVYDYFLGNGIWSILLSRALSLLCVIFNEHLHGLY